MADKKHIKRLDKVKKFDTSVMLRMEKATHEKLKEIAVHRDKSISNVIRDVLQSEINYYEELNEKP